MAHLSLCLTVALLTPVQDPVGDPAAQAPQERVVQLGFRWGSTGKVPVTETLRSGEREVVSSYEIGWAKEGPGMLVSRSPVRYLKIGGEATAEGSPEVHGLQVLDMLTPPLQVMGNGRFKGFGSLKPVEAKLARLEEEGQAEFVAAVREARKDPFRSAMVKLRMRDAWEIWVGAWQGQRFQEGGRDQAQRKQHPGYGNKPLTAQVTSECLEVLERGGVRCLRAKLTIEHAGEEVVEAVEAVMAAQPWAQQILRAGTFHSRRLEIEGLLETGSGRPHELKAVTTTTFVTPDGGKLETVEERSFVFDWAQAKFPAGRQAGEGAKPGEGRKRGGRPAQGEKKPDDGR